MKLCKVVAINQDGGHSHRHDKFIVLCGISESGRLEKHDWAGYCQDDKKLHPFVLKDGTSCFFGGDHPYSEVTNFGSTKIEPGSKFTVFSPPDAEAQWEATFEITSCQPYQG